MDVVIGEREVWGKRYPFGLSIADRRRHVYLLGKTGTGKTTLLRNLIIQDIEAGRGCMVLDPHGDLAEELLDYIPPRRIEDVIYIAPADLSHPVGLNLIERVAPDDRPLVAASVVSIFKHLWRESWGPRLEYVLYNSVAALLDYPPSRGGVSLMGVPRLFVDPDYRARIVKEISDPRVREFWEGEFPRYGPQFAAEIVSPVQNKIGSLLASPAVRNMLGQATSTIDIAEAMDRGRIIIGNLAKGRLGEVAANLIGSVLISATWNAALRRTAIPEDSRVDFVAYLDEFHSFATDAFASMLAEARKYRLSLVIGHQYLEQLSQPVRAAVFGNCGTLVAFGVGHADADEIAPEFDPYRVDALTMLSRGEVCVRSIDGTETRQPFLGATLPEVGWSYGRGDAVIEQSRRRYGRRREIVEGKIAKWMARP
jgi:hypothetical protein